MIVYIDIPKHFFRNKMADKKQNGCQKIKWPPKYKIDFVFNKKFPVNSLKLMRGLLIVKDEIKNEYIDKFFDAYWLLNIDLNDEKNITNVVNELKVDSVNFYENI